jgi:hypothetical protein
MDLTGIIILLSLLSLAIIDFLSLKKAKLPIKECLIKSLITLVASYFSAMILGVILSMIFKTLALDIEFFLIVSLILVIIFNFFRIKDRTIKNAKIKSKEKGIYNKLVFAILIFIGLTFFAWISYMYITFSFIIWDKVPEKIIFGSYGSLAGNIVTFINNIMFYIFGSFAYKIASIILFLMGATFLWILFSMILPFIKNFLKMKK